MKPESSHEKILEYLHKHALVNTYRLSKDLKIDRIRLISIVEELKDKGLVEFKHGTVQIAKIRRKPLFTHRDEIPQKVLAIKEKDKNKVEAKKIKVLQRQKEQKDSAIKILGDINPAHNFYLCDGTILKNLDDLLKAFETINDETYQYHANSEKNDFSNWIKDVVGDTKLASDLKSKNKKEAIKILNNRIEHLKQIKKCNN